MHYRYLLLAGILVACGQAPEPAPAGKAKGVIAPTAAFHVSPSGSADGDGSARSPWDLATALAHPGSVQPGDTIWLHGGTYRGSFHSVLAGSDSANVIVRQYPGERATIDGNLVVEGAAATYWGFEVMNSDPSRPPVSGVDVKAPRTRFVNLVVHDHGENGFGFWSTAPDAEIYGSVIYNNGRQEGDRGHGHGIYAQNSTGMKRLTDNVIFNQFSHGIHVYGSDEAFLRNFLIEGNVSFNNGSLSASGNAPDLLVGGGTPAERIAVVRNFTFRNDARTTATFGSADGPVNGDLVLRDNYLVGSTKLTRWNRVALTGNTFAGSETLLFLNVADSAAAYSWDRNTYVSKEGRWQPFSLARSNTQSFDFAGWRQATLWDRESRYARGLPTGTRVFVRPNRYEPGRATIIVYNWDRRETVEVDAGNILPRGAKYEVRNVQDYFGAPVASGTSQGVPLQVPMASITPAPVDGSASTAPVTGPIFNVFVLTTVRK